MAKKLDPSVAAARFWSRVRKTESCWLWMAAKNREGYGFATWNGKPRGAHRVAWALVHGSMPSDCVLHRCDNPSCVNPEHLFVGSHADNSRDREQKGRRRNLRGSEIGTSKLTDEDVREIRRMRVDGAMLQSIAERFGIHFSTVSDISRRKSWATVL